MTLPSQQKEKYLQDTKNRVIELIGRLDNGSHPSLQLQAIDEAISSMFASTWHAATQSERARVRALIPKGEENPFNHEYTKAWNDCVGVLRAALDSESTTV